MRSWKYALLLLLSVQPLFGGTQAGQPNLIQQRALADLKTIKSVFEVKYAPRQWKKTWAQWDLDREILAAETKILQKSNPTLKDCQAILRDFFHSTRDYHVSVRFYSTEEATLPFMVRSAEGKYFIVYVDRVAAPDFPFAVGDQILKFGGQPIQQAVRALQSQEIGNNVAETDLAVAEMSLTWRRGVIGQKVPSGTVEIVGIKKEESKAGRNTTVHLRWNYTPEKVQDPARPNFPKASLESDEGSTTLAGDPFFDKWMGLPFWEPEAHESSNKNHYLLGKRKGFLPKLGEKIWKTSPLGVFDGYIFQTAAGKKIGYIRVAHFGGTHDEVEEFGLLMTLFEQETDALVIDQLNNPGGSVFYFYALISILADRPFEAPKHHLVLTQEEVMRAQQILIQTESIDSDISAQRVLGQTVGGYPVSLHYAKMLRQFCQFLIGQWEKGQWFTEPTYLFGLDKIYPHPDYRYTKPVLVLINSLDYSAADFFPAILQDNKRAILFGDRTAGAGGCIQMASYPNRSGIFNFSLTSSFAERENMRPLENLGVTPDLAYQWTARDLQEGYSDYVATVHKALEKMLPKEREKRP